MLGHRIRTTPWGNTHGHGDDTGPGAACGATAGMIDDREGIAWLVSPGLALIAVTYGLARFAYGLFLPQMRAAFELSPSLLGLIGAGSYAGYCVTIVIALIYTARVGPRRMTAAAGLMAVVGMATVAASPTPWVLALGIVLAGSSTGLASPPMAAAVAGAIRDQRQDRANTLINSGTSVGVAVSGVAALLLAQQWRLAWALFALAGLVVLVWNVAVMPRARAGADHTGSQAHDATAAPASKATRLSWGYLIGSQVRARSLPLFAAALGLGFSSAVYWTFARELVVRAGELEPLASTIFWMLIGISGLVGGATDDLVRRFGLTSVLRGAFVAMAIALMLLATAPGALALAYASAALFGATYIILTGVVLIWAVRLFRSRPAAGLGVGFLLIAAGQVVGSPGAGLLAGWTSLGTAFFAFAVVAMLLACLRSRSESTQLPGATAGVLD